ncbi:MAG: hypothetical protein ACXVLQ_09425 [Bacteriovorax sp.]
MMITLEELVLGTFSFYEPMTLSQVILDMDSALLKGYPHFTKEDLEGIIKILEKKKLLRATRIDKEVGWIRIHPKRSWRSWFFSL